MYNTSYSMYSGLEYEEATLVEDVIKNLSDEDKQKFIMIYQGRRQDPTNMLLFILLGFLNIGGIHRFIMGDIGMGILYLLTFGLCWIGTIVDLVNYKTITLNYNRQKIIEVARMMNLNIVGR